VDVILKGDFMTNDADSEKAPKPRKGRMALLAEEESLKGEGGMTGFLQEAHREGKDVLS